MDIKVQTFEEVLGPVSYIAAAPSAPPSAARDLSFAVDSSGLLLNWSEPANSGGAGIVVTAGRPANGPLMYEITSYSSPLPMAQSLAYSIKDVTSLSTRLAIPNSPSVNWWVSIQTYYYNEGDTLNASKSPENLRWFNILNVDQSNNSTISTAYYPIIVGPGPNLGSLQVLDQSNNQISLRYTLPTLNPTYAYPINKLQIFNNNVNIRTIDASASNPSINFAYGSNQDFVVSSLRNGSVNTIRVEPIRNYTYAQSPLPSIAANIVPYSPMSIDSSSSLITNDGKTLTARVNMNGDPLQSALVIARDMSGSLVVSPVRTGAFYTASGSESATAGPNSVVANQTASFDTTFTNPSHSFLVVTIGSRTSDIGVVPLNASWGTFP
jgi:hypothetical protein